MVHQHLCAPFLEGNQPGKSPSDLKFILISFNFRRFIRYKSTSSNKGIVSISILLNF